VNCDPQFHPHRSKNQLARLCGFAPMPPSALMNFDTLSIAPAADKNSSAPHSDLLYSKDTISSSFLSPMKPHEYYNMAHYIRICIRNASHPFYFISSLASGSVLRRLSRGCKASNLGHPLGESGLLFSLMMKRSLRSNVRCFESG